MMPGLPGGLRDRWSVVPLRSVGFACPGPCAKGTGMRLAEASVL